MEFHLVFSLYYDGDNLRNHWRVLGITFAARGFYSLFAFSRQSTVLSAVLFLSSLFQGLSKWDPGSPEGCHESITFHSCEVKLQQESYLIKRSQNLHLIPAILSDMKEICQNVNNDLFLIAFLSLWKYRIYFHKYIISVTL